MFIHHLQRVFFACLAIAAIMIVTSCNPDEDETGTPGGSGNTTTLSTLPVSNITGSTAVTGGNITSDGGEAVTQRGVVWSTTPNPTLANNSTNDGSGVGSFTSSLSGLTANTTYYVRAYAISSAGTAYGNEVSFATVEGGGDIISNPGEGVTFDGYTYASVVLGNGQEWMAENLRTTEYANGDPIPNVSENLQWLSLTSAAWAHYDDSSNYDTPFGKLYNWYAVGDSRNVCPSGWHVPSDEEWGDFINYLDPAAEGGSNWENIAGVKMKSLEQQYWWQSANVATNESGFSGLPGGIRLYNGTFGGIGQDGYWWSSTESSATSSWVRVLEHNYDHAIRGSADFDRGLSIRCLKD